MQNKNKIPRHFQASLNTARIESRNRYRPKLVELVEMARPPTTTERNSHSVGIIQEERSFRMSRKINNSLALDTDWIRPWRGLLAYISVGVWVIAFAATIGQALYRMGGE